MRRYDSLWTALGLAWDLGYVIAIPLVALALLGRWLDKQWGSSPLMLLVGVAAAFVITSIWLAMKMKEITKEMSQESGIGNKESGHDTKNP
ncbi:AtpZ/AtpI family protein [Candidatus Uhrbacteria bacterium]|nr:AtpZ/AtpI family protein [Candidatus Uhrbacteria bacterium]